MLDLINNQEHSALASRHSAHRYSEATKWRLAVSEKSCAVVPYINSHTPVVWDRKQEQSLE